MGGGVCRDVLGLGAITGICEELSHPCAHPKAGQGGQESCRHMCDVLCKDNALPLSLSPIEMGLILTPSKMGVLGKLSI